LWFLCISPSPPSVSPHPTPLFPRYNRGSYSLQEIKRIFYLRYALFLHFFSVFFSSCPGPAFCQPLSSSTFLKGCRLFFFPRFGATRPFFFFSSRRGGDFPFETQLPIPLPLGFPAPVCADCRSAVTFLLNQTLFVARVFLVSYSLFQFSLLSYPLCIFLCPRSLALSPPPPPERSYFAFLMNLVCGRIRWNCGPLGLFFLLVVVSASSFFPLPLLPGLGHFFRFFVLERRLFSCFIDTPFPSPVLLPLTLLFALSALS